MNIRILVADEREANFFDMQSATAPAVPVSVLSNPAAALKDSDLETDKPGRGANHGAPGGAMTARHAMDGERSRREHETEQFARQVARLIDEGRTRNEFDRLVIVAGPKMLGWIRKSLTTGAQSLVAAEIAKDLQHGDMDAIRAAVPREVFFH